METWEAACITASVLVVSGLSSVLVEDHGRLVERRAAHVERVAAEFEDPACAEFVQRPVTELPRRLDWREHPCTAVLEIRRDAHLRGESTQISGADVRAWFKPARLTLGQVLTNVAVYGGLLFALLYGCGLATSLVARRVPFVGSAFRGLASVVPSGTARRPAAFLLYVVLFLAVAGAGAYTLLLAQADLRRYFWRYSLLLMM